MRKSTSIRPPSTSSHAPRQGRAGFTLLELIIVISIIALLAGLIGVGMYSALSGTQDRATGTRLETLSSMLANYAQSGQAAGGTQMQELPSVLRAIPTSGAYYSTTDTRSGMSLPLGTADEGEPIDAPLLAAPRNGLTEASFARTQAVLKRLLSVPANSDLYDSLPGDAKTGALPTSGSLLNHADTTSEATLDPALLLDGHGNLILFVPESGMTGLVFKDGRSGLTVRAADGGPFWASAGADGNFGGFMATGGGADVAAADDNVYSTQVVFEQP